MCTVGAVVVAAAALLVDRVRLQVLTKSVRGCGYRVWCVQEREERIEISHK